MRTFEDKNGKQWTIELNVGSVRRVRSLCGVDLINVMPLEANGTATESAMEKIIADPSLLVSIIYTLCMDEAKRTEIGDQEFAELFNADAVEQASNALIEEIINFSHPAKRKALTKIHQTTRRFAEKLEKELNEILANPEFDAEIESQLKRSFTGTPESSE